MCFGSNKVLASLSGTLNLTIGHFSKFFIDCASVDNLILVVFYCRTPIWFTSWTGDLLSSVKARAWLLYQLQPIILAEKENLKEMIEEAHAPLIARPVRDMAISRTTNIINNIQRPPTSGRFELKQNMIQLLHTNNQFSRLPHEDPQVHLQNFLEIDDTCTSLEVSLTMCNWLCFPSLYFGKLRGGSNLSHLTPSFISCDDLVGSSSLDSFHLGKQQSLGVKS